jgi:hypothetical protein
MKKMDGMTALVMVLMLLAIIWVLSNGTAVAHLIGK